MDGKYNAHSTPTDAGKKKPSREDDVRRAENETGQRNVRGRERTKNGEEKVREGAQRETGKPGQAGRII